MTELPTGAFGTWPRRHILGVRVDDVTWPEVLEAIDAFVRSGQPHHVVTPNPEYVVQALKSPAFHAVLEQAALAPADGIGLRWAGRLLGQPIREVVPGSDLVERLAPAAASRGDRWFLLGAAPGVAERVGQILAGRFPGLTIAGTWAGSPADDENEIICRRIEAAAPVHLLLVAYGSPAQDLWIARNLQRLQVPVAMGVGGTFDFIAGVSRRPPPWVRRLNLIWLYRLVREPWRWRRQRALLVFVRLVLCAWLSRWRSPASPQRWSR